MKTSKYSHTKREKINAKFILVIVSVLALTVFAVIGYIVFVKNGKKQSPGNLPVYSGPTEDESKQGDDVKDRLANEKPTYIEDNTGLIQTSVVVADANQYSDTIEVRAFMPNSFEVGKCEIIFEKDNLKFSKNVDAFLDNSYALCKPLEVSRNEFGYSGEWKVTVKYSSAHYSGSVSQNMELK